MSGYLVDANVISELRRPSPNRAVAAWLASTDDTLLFISVLTLGEIRQGIDTCGDAAKRAALEMWLGDMLGQYADRVLPIDRAVAERWGRIGAAARAASRPLPVIDALLAATALHHDLTVVTRNVDHIAPTGAAFLDPWRRLARRNDATAPAGIFARPCRS
jgi:predicted nucleic acid-binding protein